MTAFIVCFAFCPQIQYSVGYCPQFDALIEQLTGRETLEMYANLRGLDKHKAIASINFLAEALLLRPYMEKHVKSYRLACD